MSRVSITHENHIAHVRLTRADKMNAVDQDMIDAIIAAGQEVAASDARVVVLSGEGRAFCAGIDIGGLGKSMGNDPEAALVPRSHGDGTTNQWQEVAMIWTRVPVPVIAALQGPVFGAGCQLALGADMRIAGPDLQMSVMEMKWGLVPDMGGMVLLPRLVREDVARRLTYTATPVGAQQALDWGLVTELADEPLAAAQALAEEIAGKSPSAIRAAKALITQSYGGYSDAILMAESVEQAKLIGQPDQMEVVAAAMQKRAPVFR
ncbi:crotonase/enoyl-CoA hydratase family protein [Pseudosulfitobacter pseudonitzschiae]|uniref:crotonase/enoyl-CoA hydratase family protein n=1 Tax=Pseudosulfitobacter pseudonitzschiae TaxID=1402135 RepID=UPI001AF63D55|nr:crotonase/enoyl-CoA hydratase family protein [Pseudosulfitobacter pseudonitzschiae]MBM1815232.1 crotonase/enoyl-CoA hydratase family protein [Pseudosulfitobacter pseudonitzschiae]MBM1832223.1 crotonase/enoyl-CoA hydratase family protein [Pseudosulfitobacter pseudonitzschiae]MBM1837091.1 crotonase/enoyl-CoA hydratase family protein [Pseudosulfitobacter pseudonitzschiae]MBM1841937.1 crotonase/enoyl-CoA hydratase family protein [Pseudosulfitobacter pseudonitzschiae]MBM1846805.1 crotonase/enoyl